MKIAVSATNKDLDSPIEPRFGRCPYFLIVKTEDMSFEVFDNENISLGGGAGIQSAQFVASKGAKAVITGHCGPNAVDTLAAAGVELFTSQSGTIREAIEKHKKGELAPTNEANVPSHYGTGEAESTSGSQTRSPGSGMSGGRGMGGGRGLGRGMGRGMGMSGSTVSDRMDSRSLTKDQELRLLREQAEELKKQMEEIEARIKSTEKND